MRSATRAPITATEPDGGLPTPAAKAAPTACGRRPGADPILLERALGNAMHLTAANTSALGAPSRVRNTQPVTRASPSVSPVRIESTAWPDSSRSR